MRSDLRRLKKLLLAENAGLLLEKFEERRRVFEDCLRKARRSSGERAVHGLRVASRRLLSMTALLEAILPPRELQPVRRMVKKRLSELRQMRDVQVQIVHTESMLADFPQLTPFLKTLGKRERRLGRRARKQLGAFRPKAFRKPMDRLLDRLIAQMEPEADARLSDRLAAGIEDAYRRVLALRARIDPDRARSIHRTRLAFKKFRYMAEIAAPTFDQISEERLRAMRVYQARMGAIQDMEELLKAMMEYRRESGHTSLLVVENEIRRRRLRRIEEFVQTADEIRFFWSTPTVEARQGAG